MQSIDAITLRHVWRTSPGRRFGGRGVLPVDVRDERHLKERLSTNGPRAGPPPVDLGDRGRVPGIASLFIRRHTWTPWSA